MALSREDFRSQLYHSLQGKGILDSMKSQLRNRLVVELKRTMEGSGVNSSPESMRKSLRVQIADSIIAEYLKSTGYEYTLSIFLPEASVSMDRLCSEEDLLRFLRIPPSSPLGDRLKAHPQKPDDFLERLLEALISESPDVLHPSTPGPSPALPQPSPNGHHSSPSPGKKSVADRLEELDISYARRAQEESMKCRSSVEDRLSSFQRDLEARYKQQLETELSLYRSKELARARQDTREQLREELAKEKVELNQAHQLKLKDVKKSEQLMMEKYCRKEQELEAGIYSQRQTLLSELNSLRVKEAGLKREAELDKRAVALEKEQLKVMNEQLESNMKAMKTRFEKMAEEKVQRCKVEQELQLQSKHAELANREARLKMDSESADSLKHENELLREKLSDHQRRLEAQPLENTARDVGTHREETLAPQLHDYKKKSAEMKQQVSFWESKCAELRSNQKQQQSTIKQLQAKFSQADTELLALQAEVERLHKAHHKEMLVLEYDNKQLGRQLAAQVEHTVHCQKRLDEQLVQLRSAQREVQDLHFMLERAKPHDGRGSQSLPGKPGKSVPSSSKKTSLPTPSSSSSSHSVSKTPPPTHYHTAPPLFREDLTATLAQNQRNDKTVSFFDSSGMFLAESRATIERMEKEAQQIKRNYYDLNYEALRSSPEVQCMLSGPSPLPGLDVSFPSPLEQSSLSPPATPTGIVNYHSHHHSAYSKTEIRLKKSGDVFAGPKFRNAPPGTSLLSNPPYVGTTSLPSNPPYRGTTSLPSNPPYVGTTSLPSNPPYLGTTSLPSNPPYVGTNSLPSNPPYVGTTSVPSNPPYLGTTSLPSDPPYLGTTSLHSRNPPYLGTPSLPSNPPMSILDPHPVTMASDLPTMPAHSPDITVLPSSDPHLFMPAPYRGSTVPLSDQVTAVPHAHPATQPQTDPPVSLPIATAFEATPSRLPAAPDPPIPVPAPDSSSTPPPVVPVPSSLTHLPKAGASAKPCSEKVPHSAAETDNTATRNSAAAAPLSFTLRTLAPAPVRNVLSTEISSPGNTTVFPKSNMSLDSWWKAPSEPSVTKMPQVESADITPHSVSSPELTATVPTVISSSPAVTRLTGATHTPIPSTASGISKDAGSCSERGSSCNEPAGVKAAVSNEPISHQKGPCDEPAGVKAAVPNEPILHQKGPCDEPAGVTAAVPTEPKSQQAAGDMTPTGLTESLLPLKEDSRVSEPPSEKQGDKSEDGIDPVMLKYMQLVKEKRQGTEHLRIQSPGGDRSDQSQAKLDFGVPPLSQDASSLDGFSNHEDAFEDW